MHMLAGDALPECSQAGYEVIRTGDMHMPLCLIVQCRRDAGA